MKKNDLLSKAYGKNRGPAFGLLSVLVTVALFLLVLVGITAVIQFVMS